MAKLTKNNEFYQFVESAKIFGGDNLDEDWLLQIFTGADGNLERAINHLMDTPDSKKQYSSAPTQVSSSKGKHQRRNTPPSFDMFQATPARLTTSTPGMAAKAQAPIFVPPVAQPQQQQQSQQNQIMPAPSFNTMNMQPNANMQGFDPSMNMGMNTGNMANMGAMPSPNMPNMPNAMANMPALGAMGTMGMPASNMQNMGNMGQNMGMPNMPNMGMQQMGMQNMGMNMNDMGRIPSARMPMNGMDRMQTMGMDMGGMPSARMQNMGSPNNMPSARMQTMGMDMGGMPSARMQTMGMDMGGMPSARMRVESPNNLSYMDGTMNKRTMGNELMENNMNDYMYPSMDPRARMDVQDMRGMDMMGMPDMYNIGTMMSQMPADDPRSGYQSLGRERSYPSRNDAQLRRRRKQKHVDLRGRDTPFEGWIEPMEDDDSEDDWWLTPIRHPVTSVERHPYYTEEKRDRTEERRDRGDERRDRREREEPRRDNYNTSYDRLYKEDRYRDERPRDAYEPSLRRQDSCRDVRSRGYRDVFPGMTHDAFRSNRADYDRYDNRKDRYDSRFDVRADPNRFQSLDSDDRSSNHSHDRSRYPAPADRLADPRMGSLVPYRSYNYMR